MSIDKEGRITYTGRVFRADDDGYDLVEHGPDGIKRTEFPGKTNAQQYAELAEASYESWKQMPWWFRLLTSPYSP